MSSFQRPNGTRDLYPLEMARRQWLFAHWRRVARAHGFDEVDGPTFEHLDLYTVKSGDGIVSELFSFARTGGNTTFALRPEFTPTVTRLYAAQAGSLPKPTKWFSIGPNFRAERPQRGRLREFIQWNVDCIGQGDTEGARVDADAEVIACCAAALRAFGLSSDDVTIKISDRAVLGAALADQGIGTDRQEVAMALLDKVEKLPPEVFAEQAREIGLDHEALMASLGGLQDRVNAFVDACSKDESPTPEDDPAIGPMQQLALRLSDAGVLPWCRIDLSIVRGLAYYTGTVFEATVDGERAVAGGGRYDGLVELVGGPPTPAVGFAMGDVVLSLVLQDKGLMPSDDEIAAQLGLRPDAFVFAGSGDVDDRAVPSVVAQLRALGLHARRTYKSTRNVGKLLKDASKVNARFAIIVESADRVTVKNLDTGEQLDPRAPSELNTDLFS